MVIYNSTLILKRCMLKKWQTIKNGGQRNLPKWCNTLVSETQLCLLCPGPLFFLACHSSLECEYWGFILFLPYLISFHLLVWDLPEYWLYKIVFLRPVPHPPPHPRRSLGLFLQYIWFYLIGWLCNEYQRDPSLVFMETAINFHSLCLIPQESVSE